MFFKGSRYLANSQPNKGRIQPRDIHTSEGLLEHCIQQGERIDLLAYEYYDDARLWWKILDANPHINDAAGFSMDAFVGELIVIPGE